MPMYSVCFPFMSLDAPDRPGLQNYKSCTVKYTSVLTFFCHDTSLEAATWVRMEGDRNITLCDGPVCKLNLGRELHNEDSGFYFCRVPVGNGSKIQNHFTQLTVQGSVELSDACSTVVSHGIFTTARNLSLHWCAVHRLLDISV